MITTNFSNLPLVTGDIDQVANWLASLALLDANMPIIVSHINANNYYLLCKYPTLSHQLRGNAHLLLDGIGMKLAACLLGLGWLPDLNGTDLFPLVMRSLVSNAVPIYFLGAEESVIQQAIKHTHSRWSEACIVGYSSGYFTEADEDRIARGVNASGAKVLLIGRGFPLQEELSLRMQARLKVSLIWNVGGLFDFVSETKPRAPLWMRQMRLEWLFRFLLEPQRMWHRTVVVGPWLLAHILKQQRRRIRSVLNKEVKCDA